MIAFAKLESDFVSLELWVYGGFYQPSKLEKVLIYDLVEDMVGLLDALDIEKKTICLDIQWNPKNMYYSVGENVHYNYFYFA